MGVSTAGELSIHGILEDAARRDPDRRAVSFIGGPDYSRAELLEQARRVAAGLISAGIGPGDRVAIMVGNRPEFVFAYLAVSSIGAVSVPLNTALRGDVLAYMLEAVGPCALIVDGEFLDTAMPMPATPNDRIGPIWVVDGAREGCRLFAELTDAAPIDSSHVGQPWDLLSIMFTSGTTGRSKGVMWSQQMALTFCENSIWIMGYTDQDVVYTCLPLFHINALFVALFAGLLTDAPVVVSPRFSTTRYWAEVTDCGATVTNMLGAIGAILWKEPPSAQERAHRLRLAMVVPFPAGHADEFEARFGMQINELYGSTDTGIPIGIPHGSRRHGSCGLVAPGWQVDLVDEHDNPVGPGVPGELVTRPARPFVGQLGYWNQPDKTWEAHRNAWFHTGDMLVRDEEGWFYFRDRSKDSLRVSGENVSSFEVEQVVMSHPDVAEVAVYGVPSDLGEDLIAAAVVMVDGATATASDLIDHCAPRLPYFAVPRYVRIVASLPKTSTQKVQKQVLRDLGVSADTWDAGPRRRSADRAG